MPGISTLRALEASDPLAPESGWVYEALPAAIFLTDGEGMIVRANPAAERTFGIPEEQMVGRRPAELWSLTAEDGSAIPAEEYPIVRALRTGEPVEEARVRLTRPDGARRWLQIAAAPYVTDEGTRAGISCGIDVTARVEAEETLRESEERYRAVVQHSADGIVILVGDRLVFANPAAASLAGVADPEALLRVPLAELLGDAFTSAILARARARQRGEEFGARYVIERPNLAGEIRTVEIAATIVRWGGEIGSLAMLRDVSAQRERERQREALARGESLRALGQMAGGIAHDLNQSLALIGGAIDLVLDSVREGDIDEAALVAELDLAARAARDGGKTVQRLLQYARQREANGSESVDIQKLFAEVAALTAPRWRDAAQAEGRPIVLTIACDADAVVEGWPGSLREALTNLIFNAVEAMPAGGCLDLRARRAEDKVLVEVADQGSGMTPEVQARIFEPFFTTKGDVGTGLGLSQVRAIVDRHGGSITVRSAPGDGTTVQISLPAAVARPVVPLAPRPETAAGPRRILVVDDEPSLARMARLMLERRGHMVEVTHTAEAAIERLALTPFDVVVSDMSLGQGMNGWALAARVRADWPAVRFVLATGWGAGIDPADARARGVAAVVAKPFTAEDLLAAIGDEPAPGAVRGGAA